jgi:hypothetical protein
LRHRKQSHTEKSEDRRIALIEKPKLKLELRRLEVEARHLAAAIAQFGTHRSPTLLSQLSHAEKRIVTIERHLQEAILELPNVLIERLREFVLQQASNLKSVLLGDRGAAKLALRMHFKPLILSPKETEKGPVLSVHGSFDLFSGLEDVMLLVAPQGFTGDENKDDTAVSTAIPTPFPTHRIRIRISICCALRRTFGDRLGHWGKAPSWQISFESSRAVS